MCGTFFSSAILLPGYEPVEDAVSVLIGGGGGPLVGGGGSVCTFVGSGRAESEIVVALPWPKAVGSVQLISFGISVQSVWQAVMAAEDKPMVRFVVPEQSHASEGKVSGVKVEARALGT